jgi:CubicO group peptidase (beta-lactamase class C family)
VTTQTSRLEETIAREIDRSGLTGLAIALIRGEETIWSAAYGTASIETNELLTTDTSFSVMSVTKTIVSTAAMRLRDRGLFQLDDPSTNTSRRSRSVTSGSPSRPSAWSN